jgi:hypothetical protein
MQVNELFEQDPLAFPLLSGSGESTLEYFFLEAVLGSPAQCRAWDYVDASDCRAQLVAGKSNLFSVVDHVLRVTNAPQPPRHPIYHTPQGEARGVSKEISESYRDDQKTVCLFTIAENKRHVFQA